MNINIPQSTNERLTQPKALSLDAYTSELLSDEDISQRELSEQGDVIVDRFIGALVRQGTVEGTKTSYTPEESLLVIDAMGQSGPNAITSKNGLRPAAIALAQDERTARLVGVLSPRLAATDDYQPVLTSAAQVEGYIASGGDRNAVVDATPGVHKAGDQWIPAVVAEVARVTAYAQAEWTTAEHNADLMHSDVALVQESARDLDMSYRAAERVGVDLALLKRSAEFMQKRQATPHAMSQLTLRITGPNGRPA